MTSQPACAIAVMAKAPLAGAVKTRLVPPLRPEEAATMSAAFIRDITENIVAAAQRAPIAGYVAFAPAGAEALFADTVAPGTRLVLADGGPIARPGVTGFGRSLLHAVEALFAKGHAAVCVLNADSPTLPTELLAEAALALLLPGERAVLGPAEDGGYYLLGMQAPHARLFEDVAWSTDQVAAQTRARARDLALDMVELAPWFDVDDRASLQRLLQPHCRAAASGTLTAYAAPNTSRCIERLGLRALLGPVAATG